jgi:hypothetical protein
MEELRPGLWWWTAPHPDWKPEDAGPTGWDRDVSCYAVETGGAVVLVDPQAPPAELAERAVAVALTCEWHGRDARALALPVYEPGTEGAPPPGLEAKPLHYEHELAFWLPEHRALVFGDVVSVRDGRPGVNWGWIPAGGDPSTIGPALRPLLELPVELLLTGHGPPVREDVHAALARALDG